MLLTQRELSIRLSGAVRLMLGTAMHSHYTIEPIRLLTWVRLPAHNDAVKIIKIPIFSGIVLTDVNPENRGPPEVFNRAKTTTCGA